MRAEWRLSPGITVLEESQEVPLAGRAVMTFGFIPSDWSDSKLGGQRIAAGDPAGSKTKEFDVQIDFDDDGNASFDAANGDRAIDGTEFWDSKSAMYKELAARIQGEFGVKVAPKLLQQMYALFLDELETDVKQLVTVSEADDGAEFVNSRGKFNGCMYVRYFLEENDEDVMNERVVVVRPSSK